MCPLSEGGGEEAEEGAQEPVASLPDVLPGDHRRVPGVLYPGAAEQGVQGAYTRLAVTLHSDQNR